jgi:hypothetical protein
LLLLLLLLLLSYSCFVVLSFSQKSLMNDC